MIGYVIVLVIFSIFVRRLQTTEGVEISKGRCHLKTGYGKLPSQTTDTQSTNQPFHDIGEYNSSQQQYSFS